MQVRLKSFIRSVIAGGLLLASWTFLNRAGSAQPTTPPAAPPSGQGGTVQPAAPTPAPARPAFPGFRGEDGGESEGEEVGLPLTVPPAPVGSPTASATAPSSAVKYRDGVYAASKDISYGTVQVQVTVSGGKWTDVKALQTPDSPPSQFAAPYLVQQALQAQSAAVDGVSGATYYSNAFRDDLANIAAQSKI